MTTQSQAKNWISAHKGKTVNPDHVWGGQCMDLIVQYCLDLFNWHPYGNAKAMWTQKLPRGWRRLKNTPSLVPQAGDIVVWKPAAWNGYYGHIALATGKGNTSYFQSLDQNWYNASSHGSPAAYVNHSYVGTYAIYGVVRPVWSLPVPAATKLSKPLDFTAKLSTTNVWDLTTNPYYKAATVLKKGAPFTAYAKIAFNGQTYYVTEWSYNHKTHNGVNSKDLIPVPPKEVPVEPKPPVDDQQVHDDPTTAQQALDMAKANNSLLKQILALLQSLADKISGIFK